MLSLSGVLVRAGSGAECWILAGYIHVPTESQTGASDDVVAIL